MNAFVTLLKREWLEARTPFFWLPLGTLAFIIVIGVIGLTVSGFGEFHIQMTTSGDAPNFLFLDQWTEAEVQERMLGFRMLAGVPFFLIYAFAALFVLLGALYDDRKDRSVLFWKSMPVSDLETVLSKWVLVVWIAPLVTLAFVVIAQIFALLVISIYVWSNEFGSVGRLWWHSGLITGNLQMLLGIFLQSLWALPVTAYLLLISASVPRLTLLWAILVPVVVSIAEYVVFRSSIISAWLDRHLETAAIPAFNSDERVMPVVRTVGDQLALLGSLDLWVGVVIGAAFLYAASRMRGIKNEL